MSGAKRTAALREIKTMLDHEGASLVSCERSHRGFEVIYKINERTFKAVMDNPAKASWIGTRLMISGIRASKRKAFICRNEDVKRAPSDASHPSPRKFSNQSMPQSRGKS